MNFVDTLYTLSSLLVLAAGTATIFFSAILVFGNGEGSRGKVVLTVLGAMIATLIGTAVLLYAAHLKDVMLK